MPALDPAAVLGGAVERWGDDADARLIGSYAALVVMPDGTVRMSRAPWTPRALFFWSDGDTLVASSVTRPLFAAGVPKKLRPGVLAETLSFTNPTQFQTPFDGIETFPAGHILHMGRGSRHLHCFHDAGAVRPIRFARDEDYVEAARELLGEAVSAALRVPARPGVTLSGGLDSALVTAEILRQRPGRRLPSFTFRPLSSWDGEVARHKFGDDGPAAERFAAMYPDLDPVFTDNAGIDFDNRLRERMLAGDAFYPGQVSGSVYDGLYEAARARGCDWLLFAGYGNYVFSNDAPWAAAEFFRTGRWQQLHRLLAAHPDDPRPMWRRFLARGMMPNLPPPLRGSLRRMVHGSDASPLANPWLGPDLAASHPHKDDSRTMFSLGNMARREDFVRGLTSLSGIGSELWEVDEQVFGLQTRDVTAYRPLIEFCLGLPTDQFVRDGETRWLARRMAIGRMPEEQRTNALFGEHNVDWHARLTPRLPELRRRAAALRDHPELAGVLDVEAMLAEFDTWPERTIHDRARQNRLRFTLPAVLSFADYLDYVSGRNTGG